MKLSIEMGQAELVPETRQLIIHARLYFYGDAADEAISNQVAADIAQHWNTPAASVRIRSEEYSVHFSIEGYHAPWLTPNMVYDNDDPRNNYFRIENEAHLGVSSVDGVGCNTGYFLAENLIHHSTTAAHEFGHSLGLDHPRQLNIRGKGVPGIMYPRGTLVDPAFQWNPSAAPGEPGATMSPYARRVLAADIAALRLHRLRFDAHRKATVGEFSSVWHNRHHL